MATSLPVMTSLPLLFDVVDEAVGAGVVGGGGCGPAQFWLDDLGQLLSQFNTAVI